MKINAICAKNFRTLEDIRVEFSANYCAISGQNNAGKSAIVRIIQYFLNDSEDGIYSSLHSNRISISKDKTQWSSGDRMQIAISMVIDRKDDSEVFFVLQTYSSKTIEEDKVNVEITQDFLIDGSNVLVCSVNEELIEGQKASEILKKFRSASNLIVHNSTLPNRRFVYFSEGYTEVLEAHFSSEDRKRVVDAEKTLQSKIKQAARQHKEELERLLGKLNEKYQVELTSVNSGRASSFPLGIKLTDKSVDVPLGDWGAGTQNRTRILMSVLDAARIRSSVTAEDRSTPVFIVEEPESFLHPSAQAEFGQVLNELAEELKIQIIATTHSPYLLNQTEPRANILLNRRMIRKLPKETQIIDTSGDDWMLPFSNILGIVPSEFKSWKNVFATQSSRVVLVEGDLDQKYFEHFKKKYPELYGIPLGVEIVPYGGKDALKNTPILQFMISKFGRVFVTFDLDAEGDVRSCLERIGLEESKDFCAIGVTGPGCDCIEGLLPPSLKRQIYAERHDLVTAMGSQDSKARTSAKNALKAALFEKFSEINVDEKELSEFKRMFSSISKAFSK